MVSPDHSYRQWAQYGHQRSKVPDTRRNSTAFYIRVAQCFALQPHGTLRFRMRQTSQDVDVILIKDARGFPKVSLS